MTISISGLSGSGLDTTTIISELMQAERIPEQQMQTNKSNADAKAAAWSDISNKLTVLQSDIQPFAFGTAGSTVQATSSDTSVISASGSGSVTGSFTFQVNALAAAGQIASTGYNSPTAVVGAGTVTVGTGLPGVGISAATSTDLPSGSHTLNISQASDAARVTGTALSGPITVPSGAQLSVGLNGASPVAVNVAAGTYANTDALVTAVNSALQSAGLTGVTASNRNGSLSLATTNEGSAATLAVSGDASLGLSATPANATGVDAIATLDGVATTISNVSAGTQVTLPGQNGSLQVTLTNHLSAGTATATQVSTSGTGATISDLANAINASGSAAVSIVSTGSNSGYEMVVSSKNTGLSGAVTLGVASGMSGLGSFTTLRQASDAQIQMGSQTITRSTNTIGDVMPGVTLNLLKASPGENVTVTASPDTAATVQQLNTFVNDLNSAITTMNNYAKADTTNPGVLNSSNDLLSLHQSLVNTLQNVSTDPTWKVLSQVGVQIQQDGTFKLDQGALTAALNQDPQAVSKVMARSAQALDTRLSYAGASDVTQAGSYNVTVTQAAQKAAVTGATFSSVANAETLTFKLGSQTGTYTTLAGSTIGAVVAGLNAMFNSQSLSLLASINSNGQLAVTSRGYGSASSFSITSTGTDTGLGGQSGTGTDVAGTINGVAATGTGQILKATTGAANGLAVTVAATPADLLAAGGNLNLGSIAYRTGAAGSFLSTLNNALSQYGTVTTQQQDAQTQSTTFQSQIDTFEARMTTVEARYDAQFTAMETALSQLKSQQAQFTASLPSTTSSSSGH